MRDRNFLVENNAKPIWHPMAHPAEMRAQPPRIVMKGEGVEVTDIDGKTVIDAVGGLWNVNLGYSCDPIKQAIADQLSALPYYSGFRGTSSGPSIELAYELTEWFKPEGMVRAFFTSGGSDSVETALRLARQYWKIKGQADRTKFLALKKGYHGTHFGGASVNGNANFRRNYEPMLPGVFHIPAPSTYRNPFSETDPARLAQLCAAAMEEEIAFQGADTIAAFIMEPVLGAGGVIVPPDSFMKLVREICDRHGILMIADEVVTGFGRTGAWSGFAALGREARHDDDGQGDHVRLFPARRDADRRADRGGLRGRHDHVRLDRPRLHLFRSSGRLRRRSRGARRDPSPQA
ncbi:adenosylmethionine-8-amino-7-oxononanoate aminotransferase [Bradyrhizobium elkanii]